MRHFRHRNQSTLFKNVCSVTLFLIATALMLVGIKVLGDQYPNGSGKTAVGSLEGRFDLGQITREYNGSQWLYRDQDLTNILIMGVDWDEERAANASWRYAGQADFLLLVTLDEQKELIRSLQIDRDTMSTIRIYGPFGDYTGERVMQLCLSHAYGDTKEKNCENAVWAVSNYLGGVPIDAYISLNMESLVIINDALGGITVTLNEDFSHLDPAMTQGRTLRLQGKQAEYYLRGRIGIGEGTNASRMQRQRNYLDQAMAVFVERIADDMSFVGNLYDKLAGHLHTNAERGWLINQVYEASGFDVRRILTIAGEHRASEKGFMEFWTDEDALNELVIRNYYQRTE